MEKTGTEIAVKRIGTILLVGLLLSGVILSGVLASDVPEEAVIEATEASEISESTAQAGAAEAETDIAETAEPEEQYESEAAEVPEEPVIASLGAEFSDNFISGVIWLDENEDGIMDSAETGIEGFPVSLYQDDQIIDVTETDTDGGYRFEQLEPGEYVIGVQAEVIEETEYLIPLCGISGDNMFELTELADGSVVALSDPIEVTTDTQVEDVNAGMRLPMGIMPVAGETYIVTRKSDSAVLDACNSLADAVTACEVNVPCVITATKDDTLTAMVEIPADKDIILESDAGNSWTITQEAVSTSSSSTAARHFTVKGNLTIESVTLQGQGFTAADSKYNGGVYIAEKAIFTMNSDAVIAACSNYYGGGVYMSSSVEFKMMDSEISNNEALIGGGVYMDSLGIIGGEFKMIDSEISNNKATSIGGGVYMKYAEFEMMGGDISYNEALNGGGGVYLGSNSTVEILNDGKISNNKATSGGGGGIYVASDSTVEMMGGEISYNEASNGGGVYVLNSSTFKMPKDDEISWNTAKTSGGGIYVGPAGTVEMGGGKISDNEATSGGGVYVNGASCKFEMTDGEINDNEATSGGGIYVGTSGAVEMMDGKISGNEATSGGGVYTGGASCKFEMMGGEISGNEALNGGNGGGVYAIAGRFEMTDGEISGNEALIGDGGGIYVAFYSYSNPAATTSYSLITIDPVATVQNNTAASKNVLPVNYADFTGFPGELLNNNEINYKGPYLITYDANNGMGESQIIEEASSGTSDAVVTLLTDSETNFTPPAQGVVLAGWNTQAGGNGISYDLGETIPVSDYLTLYAVWKQNDFEITEEYRRQDNNNEIQGSTSTTVTAGADYEQGAPVLTGYRYLGYQIDGGAMQSGAEVKISSVDQPYTVTFLYEEYNETIHISVPVKLLWAAFEEDKGEVTSPEYYFYNHSSHAISVTMQELTISKKDDLDLVAGTNANSGDKEVALQLNPIEDSLTGWRSSSISQLSLLDGTSGSGLLGKIEADSRGIFDIIGTYGGYFTGFDIATETYLQPAYEALFRFELTN